MSAATETSPLLVPAEAVAEVSVVAPESLLARDYFKRSTRIIPKIILALAILGVVCIIASAAFLENGPFTSPPWRYWRLQLTFENLGFYLAFAAVLSVINLRYNFVIGFNMIADLFLAWFIGISSIDFYVNLWPKSTMCELYWGPLPDLQSGNPTPAPGCLGAVLALQFLVGIIIGLGVAIALMHFVLLVLRCIACVKARAWTRLMGFQFPTGEITLSVSIKVLRQQPATGATEGMMASEPAVQVITA